MTNVKRTMVVGALFTLNVEEDRSVRLGFIRATGTRIGGKSFWKLRPVEKLWKIGGEKGQNRTTSSKICLREGAGGHGGADLPPILDERKTGRKRDVASGRWKSPDM